MRKLQFALVALFLVVSIVFSVYLLYDRLFLDHTAPQIVCDGVPLRVSVSADDRTLCSGLTAYDDVDGDLTDRIIVRKISRLIDSNTASIYYAVFDSSSNYCTFSRTVTYTDHCKPKFSLSQPLNFTPGSVITLSDRLTAYDVIDGDISERIRVASSGISVSEPGEYQLNIQVTNSSGDTTILTLPVLIEASSHRHPTISLSEYLYYIPLDSAFTEDDMRSMIVAVRESAGGSPVAAEEVALNGSVDTSKRGAYPITYTYKNAEGLSHSVILTVIVE